MSNLVIIKIYSSRFEAEVDMNLLESYKIKSIVFSDDCGGIDPSLAFTTGGARLLVNEKDTNQAKNVLKIK
jgi:hypothetical protein